MVSRREAREHAVQLLFQHDFNPGPLDEMFRAFWANAEGDAKSRGFTEELVRGVLAHRDAIDGQIRSCAENWDLDRMGAVERNAMRVAIYEMLFREDIPPVVSIDEALEITKAMSDQAAVRFVNGILDRIRKTLPRSARATSCSRSPAEPGAASDGMIPPAADGGAAGRQGGK